MSTRSVLNAKGRPRVHACSLESLLIRRRIKVFRAQCAAIKDAAQEAGRDLHDSEKEELAAIEHRIEQLKKDLAISDSLIAQGKAENAIHLLALSGAGRSKYMSMNKEHVDKGEASVPAGKVVALAACDGEGKMDYDLDNDKDVAEACSMDGEVLDAIALEVLRISGISQDAVEEAEKKSVASPSASGGIGSHENSTAQ